MANCIFLFLCKLYFYKKKKRKKNSCKHFNELFEHKNVQKHIDWWKLHEKVKHLIKVRKKYLTRRHKKENCIAKLLFGNHYFFNKGHKYKGLRLLKYAKFNLFIAYIISTTKTVMKFKLGFYGLLNLIC